MKIICFFVIIFLIYSSQLFCQHNKGESTLTETTALTKIEKETFNHIVEIYKAEAEKNKPDCNECLNYILDVLPEIDSLRRTYYLDENNIKKYLVYNTELVVNEEEGGYYGDKVKITMTPDFSMKRGYMDIVIDYPAAGVSTAEISLVINEDIYDTYRYFTNHGGGHSVYRFRVNAVEKFSGEQDMPYENNIYR